MPDCMTFPNDWHDFIKDYSFKDTDHVYTNGSELIQVFRVEQLIEHLLKEQEAKEVEAEVINEIDRLYRCPSCHISMMLRGQPYCHYCGQAVKWE